ncbi:hypothetical protein J4050_10165 [Winogradskyella sp. DF17]|uniref:Cellobiose phosphorylase n=1 Tax=Winogradskyella pelagia TaxID=2819984 RepID=A0ABS3T4D1_9FLAO|nr:hypothetical protein [Winogradskyella sp. DF17]MBO3117114.1 hypothetical protein [Winogradskyella sp. DF17]
MAVDIEDLKSAEKQVTLEKVGINNQDFFKISNSDAMRPFFMSIVSDSNHWMFISSNGGLTAGRKNAEYSIFPYYSDDKITESAEITGAKSIFQVTKSDKQYIWEPFSIRYQDKYKVRRNLYKSVYGNAIIFEEINLDLELSFRYEWSSSNLYGFVKTSRLLNHSDADVEINILDGIQNVLPFGVSSALQNASSNLVDAYKRTELVKGSGIGIFALSAIIVDKAEPSEALKANVAWSLGLKSPSYLLSSLQLERFRAFKSIQQETDIKAEKGAYFVNETVSLSKDETKEWCLVTNVNQDQSDIVSLSKAIKEDSGLWKKVQENIALGTKKLIALNAASDGIQLTSDNFRDTRHFSNTLFNIMRGGIFDDGYTIEKWDFKKYLRDANKDVVKKHNDVIDGLAEKISLANLKEIANDSSDPDFSRLTLEYMPLKFSRRHGDPSRPWNKFSINTRSEVDGSKILDYEGNWRDIFQNWEALVHSYPEYIENMIHKFLNASTFDGYNPYRVTKGGFDWEISEPDDPWSYIGYWGDHQIIYLQKFLEIIENHQPGKLSSFFTRDIFVYANVPYRIKSYEKILQNPKDTIEFDDELDKEIRAKRNKLGADGALLCTSNGDIVRANFMEKILATTLSKLSNFVPEAGIWMNTQRPEWNDANNALVGNGVSMVTLYYLRRFLKFFEGVFNEASSEKVSVSKELGEFFSAIKSALMSNEGLLASSISDKDRKSIMDLLGEAGSTYRYRIYEKAFTGDKTTISLTELKDFTTSALKHLEHAIKANKREDNMYHAYNLITVNEDNSVSVSYLDEMLEGQVAVLSSGYLSSSENLKVLDGLKQSSLFRPDQYSYILYPNKDLKGFMERNIIPDSAIEESQLFKQLLEDDNRQLINKDVNGEYHFNGNFKNAEDVKVALNNLEDGKYASLASKERTKVLRIFEGVFNHKAFTGRSGTFYGYEGLGSIYWHMVSKLQLAVLECCLKAISENEDEVVVGKLLEHYYEINEGIGVHKSPQLYGAFPTDPYSHTPYGKGAQQPGMTGQVKEDILSRFGELGVFVNDGHLYFDPCMLRSEEFLSESEQFNYVDVNGQQASVQLQPNQLAFTYCQVPVIYETSDNKALRIKLKTDLTESSNDLVLNNALSSSLFNRKGEIEYIKVFIDKGYLK